MKRIAIEEHFDTKESVNFLRLRTDYPKVEAIQDPKRGRVEVMRYSPEYRSLRGPVLDKLLDIAELRLKEMDEAGIDVQVLSLVAPGPDVFDAATGTSLARK